MDYCPDCFYAGWDSAMKSKLIRCQHDSIHTYEDKIENLKELAKEASEMLDSKNYIEGRCFDWHQKYLKS